MSIGRRGLGNAQSLSDTSGDYSRFAFVKEILFRRSSLSLDIVVTTKIGDLLGNPDSRLEENRE